MPFCTDYYSGLIYHRWSDDDGATWTSSWAGVPTSPLPSGIYFYGRPAVVSDGPGRLNIIAHDNYGHLYYQTYSNGSWSPAWSPVPGTYPSFPNKVGGGGGTPRYGSPAAVSWGPGRIDLFAWGSSNELEHLWYDGSNGGWHPSENLGGNLGGNPTVSSGGLGI
jgi:hypothetical protein